MKQQDTDPAGTAFDLKVAGATGERLRGADLVYNPIGPSLPPDQALLEVDCREYLDEHHGIRFTALFTIENMPIGRFLSDLRRVGRDGE